MFTISKLDHYRGKWNLTESAKLTDADKASIRMAKVVNSDYGKSVCLFLSTGGYSYLPVSTNGRQPSVGEVINLDDITVETLSRDGDKDIYRAKLA